jgi:MoxR-like ATPase
VKTCVFGSHAVFQALQVSAGALSELLTAVGTPEGAPPVGTLPTPLTTDQLRIVRQEALSTVHVPSHVIDLLVDLRTYLQELLEPPTYVSDRRMVKALELMKVRAHHHREDALVAVPSIVPPRPECSGSTAETTS